MQKKYRLLTRKLFSSYGYNCYHHNLEINIYRHKQPVARRKRRDAENARDAEKDNF